ncbi:MAG: exosortase/archaeosortase family protein [Kiritimatiellae bacterium]|nr:exosortase/archaeosortase family protein [Kiritimatiellia bacterium]
MSNNADANSLPKPDFPRLAIFALAALGGLWLYARYGTDSAVAVEGRSIFNWVRLHWRLDPDNFRTNWAMLAMCVLAVWLDRGRLAAARVSSSWRGTAVVALSLAVHVIGFRSQLPRLSLASTATALWGLAWAVWGWDVAKILVFPAGYLLLSFTNSLLVEVTMPLRLAASKFAVVLLQGVGIAAANRGTVVQSAAGGGFTFDVADACSGLRSLVTMTSLAAPYAWYTLRGAWRKAALFALSVPLAMLANALRIFTLGVVAEWIGMKLAMQLYHDLSGYIVFFLSIILLTTAGSVLNKDWKAKICEFRQKRRLQG